MSALHAAVLTSFKQQGWAYRKVPDMEVIEADFEAHQAKIPLHVQTFGESCILSVVALASFEVPRSHLPAVAELLMRTNKDLNIGNFETDWDAGRVMFRITNVFPPNRYDERIIASLVHNAVVEMDRLTPYLAEIVRTPTGELLLLGIPELMAREDLLPQMDAE